MTRHGLIQPLADVILKLLALRLGFLPSGLAVAAVESVNIKCPNATDDKNKKEKAAHVPKPIRQNASNIQRSAAWFGVATCNADGPAAQRQFFS